MTESLKSLPLQSIAANDTTPAAVETPLKTAPAAPAADEQSVRLVVEPTHGGQSYTYRLYDRVTGALLIELPREDAVKLGQSPDYLSGQVLNTTA